MPDPRDRHTWDSKAQPDEAAAVLALVYGELSCEEALFRAFLAEHNLKLSQAQFWVEVYGQLNSTRHTGENRYPEQR